MLSGTPVWLWELFIYRCALPGSGRSSAANKASLVPVLPTEPVTPMIVAPVRARPARPRLSSPAMVSATSTCGCGVALPTTAPAAPRSEAEPRYLCPSVVSPLDRTSVVEGKSVSVRVDQGCARDHKK